MSSILRTFNIIGSAFIAAVNRLDKSLNPKDTLHRLRKHHFTFSDSIYIAHILNAIFWLIVMRAPIWFRLALPLLFTTALLIPLTSQFFLPAVPVFTWLITFFTSRFLPNEYRPEISVSLLPTLESVLYGANISDILTRFTHPVLDLIAWLPYGVLHYTLPFVVAAFLWLFRPKEVLHFWARTFGYMMTLGVVVQIILPCAAPWYEIIYGLTPANYDMRGSAGGLLRIDALFGSKGYQMAFASSPLVFGAFPSLHSGCATLEALFWSHFFPWTRKYAWGYAGVLYWATMYLSHHYLIDVVGGACLATASFYLFLPEELRGVAATMGPGSVAGRVRSKHELYDLDVPRANGRRYGHGRGMSSIGLDTDLSSETSSPRHSEDEQDFEYRSPNPSAAPPSAGPKTKRSHKHTASIASLIRAEDRVEDGWSPVGNRGFVFPPTPSKLEAGDGGRHS